MYDQRYALTAGQLIVLPSGIHHQNEVVSSPEARFIGIHFDFFNESTIQTEADMVVNEENVQAHKFAAEACAEGMKPLSSTPIYTPSPYAVQLMEQLVHEFTMRPPGYELACKALMLQLLTQLLRSSWVSAPRHASVHDDKLLEIMKQIETSPEEKWTNTGMAKQLNLSVDHMAKLFRQVAGIPLTNISSPSVCARRAGCCGKPTTPSKWSAPEAAIRTFTISAACSPNTRASLPANTGSCPECCKRGRS